MGGRGWVGKWRQMGTKGELFYTLEQKNSDHPLNEVQKGARVLEGFGSSFIPY